MRAYLITQPDGSAFGGGAIAEIGVVHATPNGEMELYAATTPAAAFDHASTGYRIRDAAVRLWEVSIPASFRPMPDIAVAGHLAVSRRGFARSADLTAECRRLIAAAALEVLYDWHPYPGGIVEEFLRDEALGIDRSDIQEKALAEVYSISRDECEYRAEVAAEEACCHQVHAIFSAGFHAAAHDKDGYALFNRFMQQFNLLATQALETSPRWQGEFRTVIVAAHSKQGGAQ